MWKVFAPLMLAWSVIFTVVYAVNGDWFWFAFNLSLVVVWSWITAREFDLL